MNDHCMDQERCQLMKQMSRDPREAQCGARQGETIERCIMAVWLSEAKLNAPKRTHQSKITSRSNFQRFFHCFAVLIHNIEQQLSNGNTRETTKTYSVPKHVLFLCWRGASIEVRRSTAKFPVLLYCCTRPEVREVRVLFMNYDEHAGKSNTIFFYAPFVFLE